MAEIKKIGKQHSNYVTIYPYRDIDFDDWPEYQDPQGNWIPYDEGWREVGFKCPYPTVARLAQIRDLTQDLTVEDRSFKILSGDPKRAAKFLTYNLIQDIVGLTDNGEPVQYDKETKEWLYNQFCVSSFLLSNFRTSYELIAGKVNTKLKSDEDDFEKKSEVTSTESSTDSKYESEDKPVDSQ